MSTTRSVSALNKLIPIRTCADRKYAAPGHVEVDLAAHCGASGNGFFLNTLVAVDVATGWTVCIPVWGKGQSHVGSAIHTSVTVSFDTIRTQWHIRLPSACFTLLPEVRFDPPADACYSYIYPEGNCFR